MLSKEKEIVAYLLKQSKPASVTQIAISCSVSDRTVYNVLSSLQNNPDFVLDMTDGGISLKENAPAKKDVIPSNYEERKQFIFRKALFGQPKVSVAEALNYLAISEATFHSDIIKMRKEIAPYHVKIQIKGDNLFFSGNYHDLKNLMQHVVYDEADQEHSLLSIQNLSVLFPSFDLELLKKCITSELKLRNVYMDEYSLMNLFLHILIYMSQQRPEQDNVQNQNKEVSGLIDGVCKRIEQDFGVQFTNAAKHQFSLMTQTRTKHNENQIQNNDPKDPRTEELVSLIYSKLLDTYNLDLGESETNCSFLLHIDNLLVRLDNNIHLNNPMAESIKHYSPFTYDMAVFVANIISNKVEKPVSESEIAYIALHIGTYIEEIKSTRNRLRTIIVCPEYYVYSSPLKKINSIYKDDLYIYDIVTSFDDLDDLDNVELVISSTESINTLPPAKLVYISSFLNDGDRKRITAKISEIRQSKRFLRSRGAIASLFDESLYFPTTNLKSKNEILDFLCNELENKGYTEPSFKQAIYNRENISPTNFGMIAVPHPVEYNASRTVIGVAKPRKPIEWSEKKSKVSIVFIIAINKMDVQLFEDVFSSIIETASNPEKLKELISCETYYEFINTLANHFCS